jgi:2-dehydropantoate 2-reductase
MRVVVYGVGAVGGTIATRLSLTGHKVIGIGRGRQLEAIRRNGVTLHTPENTRTARFPVHEAPSDIAFEPDDAILLTMKGQDTLGALTALKSAGVADQPIFCFQNGVANEPLALRFFANVYGATVMLPAEMNAPGEISAYFSPKPGGFDIGRFPTGLDAATEELGGVLETSGFVVSLRDDVMGSKYRKLLMNLNNIVEAAVADDRVGKAWLERAKAEAEAVLEAAGVAWDKADAPAWDILKITDIEGRKPSGSSTYQSVARGAGTIETDYLNGEIVLLGRLHGIETPVNAALCRLSTELIGGRIPPRSVGDEIIGNLVARERTA